MIRRDAHNAFDLITQHDHARLSGHLARHFGNHQFALPTPLEPTLRGIELHDCGWPLHDDKPTLSPDGQPLHVFQTPPEIAVKVWSESAERAASADSYAGLLVSLHVLALSRLGSQPASDGQPPAHRHSPQQVFAINKFQHAQIELQESLRHRLGMATDLPLRFGLAEESSDSRELELARNFHLLQAMDQLSLAVCCTAPPVRKSVGIPQKVGSIPVPLHLTLRGDDLLVDPWPFDVATISCRIPFRRVLMHCYGNDVEFQDLYAAAPIQMLNFTVRPR